jgi:hypothetical protein
VALACGFKAYYRNQPGSQRPFPRLNFLMLHSLSYLLSHGAGVALRLSDEPRLANGSTRFPAPFMEFCSTLSRRTQNGRWGGLSRFQEYVEATVDLGALCSNDPVCAQHDPAGHV